MLYRFEPDTRSVTVIGAATGGGIGLFITHAIQTRQDRKDVTSDIVPMVLMVMPMDRPSGWLRARPIRGDGGGR